MTNWFLSVGSQVFGTGGLNIGGGNGGDAMGGEVLSLSSQNLGGLSGGNSTVGVGNETTVGVAVVTVVVSGVSVVSVVVSVEAVVSVVESGGISSLGGKVSGLSGGDLGGLSGGNGTVGVGDELSRGSSHASEKNQELHV